MEFFKKKQPRAHSIDDLIMLRDYESAEKMIKAQLRDHPDGQLRMKLGDVLRRQGLGDAAVGEYLGASDEFLQRGFTDRANAALIRAQKISPDRPEIEARVQRMERRKRLDMIRSRALEALGDGSEVDETEQRTSQLQLDGVWELLSATEWIHSVANDQLIRILHGMQIQRCASGKRLIAEGALDSALFLLCEGEVEVRRLGSRGVVALRSFGAGDVLGDKALLDQTAWPASLIAMTDCTVLRLDRSGFEVALAGNQDPRGLIDALRSQHNDDEIVRLVNRL